MKLVTKQELLNYPEGTYYTQFRDKKNSCYWKY